MNKIKDIVQSLRLVFKAKRYLAILIISSIIMFVISLLIPVLTIPGNTFGFQISLLNFWSIILITLFSILFGLSIGMNVYYFSSNKVKTASMARKGAGNTFIAMIGAMFSGPLCGSCIATILGLLGIGGAATLSITSFLFSYRTEILILSSLLLITSIYFTGRRINKTCDNC